MKFQIIFLLVFASACSPTVKSISTIDLAAESDLIKKLEYFAIDAEFKLDTASIAPLMHERFSYIGVHHVTNKQQELTGMYNNISQRLRDGHIVDSFYLDEFRTEFFQNTAIVSFFIVTKGKIKAKPFENRRTRFYDVWVKRNNKWYSKFYREAILQQ